MLSEKVARLESQRDKERVRRNVILLLTAWTNMAVKSWLAPGTIASIRAVVGFTHLIK